MQNQGRQGAGKKVDLGLGGGIQGAFERDSVEGSESQFQLSTKKHVGG